MNILHRTKKDKSGKKTNNVWESNNVRFWLLTRGLFQVHFFEGGFFIGPLRSFVKKCNSKISELIFVTCCGSTDAQKNEKFGHGLVFKEVGNVLNNKCVLCQAFSIGIVLPEGKKENTNTFMKTHLNEKNFKGEIQERLESFIKKALEV